MNIVKGVADLIWRSSSEQTGEYYSVSTPGRFPLPKANIIFSKEGHEATLKMLWEKYLNAADEAEKRKLLNIFLEQFLIAFHGWKPLNFIQIPGEPSVIPSGGYIQNVDDAVVGCSFGHPADVILTLIDEISLVTKVLTDSQLDCTTNLSIYSESLMALDALTTVTLSFHNCKIMGHHSGVQKVTTLMKAAVVLLKTITNLIPLERSSSNTVVQNARTLQKILVFVVSIIFNFVDVPSSIGREFQNTNAESSEERTSGINASPSANIHSPLSRVIFSWHQVAIVSVMEAGGLNWLVEILRLMRRLILKEQWIEMPLQHQTLRALQSVLTDNSRGQNHFRSIGGLEVLLDGVGVPSFDSLVVGELFDATESIKYQLQDVCDLHVLSLEVLREAVFGNFSNLQFLCENGRVQKFANSFCSLAFIIQDCQWFKSSRGVDSVNHFNGVKTNTSAECKTELLPLSLFSQTFVQQWKNYVTRLSLALCHFFFEAEEIKICSILPIAARNTILVSPVYAELSLKWFTKVVLTLFPCIRTCSDQNGIPSHVRFFAITMQQYVLFVFKNVLLSLPSLIDVFRAEGVWDFIFSENFIYFGPSSAECSLESCHGNYVYSTGAEMYSVYSLKEEQTDTNAVEKFQVEAISFLECAATLSGNIHNLPECTVLLEALEQSACNPVLANALAKSLLHVLQLSTEKTVSSFQALDAIHCFLKVSCIQFQESKRACSMNSVAQTSENSNCQTIKPSCSPELSQSWEKCLKICLELFDNYFTVSEDAKYSILRNTLCITCVFDLFWEESLRNFMLKYILELMKVVPSSEEDRKGIMFLCSKYFETFTHLKEHVKDFVGPSIELLVGMRAMLLTDRVYYQSLFRECECFLHVISLLNGHMDADRGGKLGLNVIQTLTCLLSANYSSKAAFRSLVGEGYQTFRSLLLDFCHWKPSEALLNSLLDMLVDGNFDLTMNCIIKNDDVILLYLSVLRKSSDSLLRNGLQLFHNMLRDSLSNRASCVRAGMLEFLLDWITQDNCNVVPSKISPLIEVIGSHSISGKDIRKMFAMLRGEGNCLPEHSRSVLLNSMLTMMNEKGPTAFFDLSGIDSGIVIHGPVHLPLNKGFSFTCWLRVESFPTDGAMALFSFLTENGRGCYAVLLNGKLIYESINQKRQCVSVNLSIIAKKWHFVCLVHSVGRAFSGGSQLRCYLDGVIVSSGKCRYPKINEAFNCCSIGTKIDPPLREEENMNYSIENCCPFYGQIGPTYLFSDAISSEAVQCIYSLGPSYMYYFRDNDVLVQLNNLFPNGVLDAKDALASKVIFGFNAQASNGRTLFNVSANAVCVLEKDHPVAAVLAGTQLCSRRLMQQIIYCVGGISVFFPLFVQPELTENNRGDQLRENMLFPTMHGKFTNETINLIASVLDDNFANQQQMLLISGFSTFGFLLQSMPAKLISLETLSALKHLFSVAVNSGLADMLLKDAISDVFLNPRIWGQVVYTVQRQLYMFLVQQFDNDTKLLKGFYRLNRVLDIIRQFYSDYTESSVSARRKASFDVFGEQSILERPDGEEIRKIRLLLLSLGEMSLSEQITAPDIKALMAFCETCQDMPCLEDILNMIIRITCQKRLLSLFLEQVNLVGGAIIFANLLERDFEPVRLLALQLISRLLVGSPADKKGSKFFNISVGRHKYLPEGFESAGLDLQPIFSLISDRIFAFPQTDMLCVTLFDVLLGGASPKQVLRKNNQFYQEKGSKNKVELVLPQVLPLIFRFLSSCEDSSSRIKIMGDLFDLLYSNPSNIEALIDNGWNSWLAASVKLDVIRNYKEIMQFSDESKMDEKHFVINIYSFVLLHRILYVKGGWQDLEETVNFLLCQSERVGTSYQFFLRELYEDLICKLISLFDEENIFLSLPSRDNMLYLLKLVDEMLLSDMGYCLPFPSRSTEFPQFMELADCSDLNAALFEALQSEPTEDTLGSPGVDSNRSAILNENFPDNFWNIYDKLWVLIRKMNGKESSMVLPRSSSSAVPSLTQRALGLVESLNIPAAEMAAVVSGGISSALVGKSSKSVDKAMQLRGERCSRFVNRLLIFYLCRSSIERASECVQQAVPVLPLLLAVDDEQNKSRLQFFIWALLVVRSQYGVLNGGARFHVISSLIRETINCGKAVLVASIMGDDNLPEFFINSNQWNTVFNFIQKDGLLAAVADEVKYIKSVKDDKILQLGELCSKIEESTTLDSNLKKELAEKIQISLNTILISDDSRRSSFQLSMDEDQQIVAEKWIHTLRLLTDERGPWSANPFPNSIASHWKLDRAEDAWRRRLKLRRNYHFDEKLCLTSSLVSGDAALSSANDSIPGLGAYALEKFKKYSLKGIQKIADESPLESIESDGQQKVSEIEESLQHSEAKAERTVQDFTQEKENFHSEKESDNSEVLMIIPCVLVTPRRKLAGCMEIMNEFLHFCGEYMVEGTGRSSALKTYYSSGDSDLKNLEGLVCPPRHVLLKWRMHQRDPGKFDINGNLISDNIDKGQKPKKCIKRHRWWNMSKIKAVHWTRYLLRYTAIEIFFSDSAAPAFFTFASQKVAKTVGHLIVATRNEYVTLKRLKFRAGFISFVDRRLAQEMAETARESWRRREITNFEYLMILNTLSGRSYNDITQYPVFPWVLADYWSESLDLKKSSTFRDLSKPVGALDPKRFEVFEDRYHNFVDPDIPSFYYGSHYSSMGIVLFYLLRLEPFTGLHRSLQGGKFDHADRLFQSIEGTFKNCLSNTSDVKELIPEFFYMPEFLRNSNSYHFGIKQDGEPIGDVCLPPWAQGSPEEFINKNREALESEYVSSNLHHWIDLVFGYKQRGKPAVEAANVFYYLTYEGAVDLDNVEDDLQRSAIEDQIANFGQTPIQIFRKKHPRRGPPIPIAHPLKFAPGAICLTSVVSNMSNPASAVIFVNVLDSYIVTVNQNLIMSVKLWVTTSLQSGGNFTFSGSQDPFFGIGSDVLTPCKIGCPLAESFELGSQCFSTLQTPSENFLISCGSWEYSFQVISLSDGRLVQNVRYHKDVVSCVAVTPDGSFVASGSYDTTVMVWEVLHSKAPERISRNSRADILVKDCIIAASPSHILCGHDDVILCLHASAELDLVISGSKDGTCILHTLRGGRYVRSIRHPSGEPLKKLTASRHGRIVLYADDLNLHLYSINGNHISSVESNGRISSLELSSCGDFLICGGDQGQIVVRSMNSLEVLMKYGGIGKSISSVAVSCEECLIGGSRDGNLLVYSVEHPQLRKASLQRNSKSKSSL